MRGSLTVTIVAICALSMLGGVVYDSVDSYLASERAGTWQGGEPAKSRLLNLLRGRTEPKMNENARKVFEYLSENIDESTGHIHLQQFGDGKFSEPLWVDRQNREAAPNAEELDEIRRWLTQDYRGWTMNSTGQAFKRLGPYNGTPEIIVGPQMLHRDRSTHPWLILTPEQLEQLGWNFIVGEPESLTDSRE